MEQTITDGSEVLETTEVAAETTETLESDAPKTDEEKEQLKARLEEIEKKNKQLYERLKKQEKEVKEVSSETLPMKDMLFIAKADIPAEDVDDLLNFAKNMKMSLPDAYKTFSPILRERAEERKTAAATMTKGGTRSVNKTTGEDFLSKAEKMGQLPDSDEDMLKLAEARLARLRKK